MLKKVLFCGVLLVFGVLVFEGSAFAKSERKWLFHIMKKGETVTSFVQKYSKDFRMDERSFRKWNGISASFEPLPGDIVMFKNIPRKKEPTKVAKIQKSPTSKKKSSSRADKVLEAIRFAGNKLRVRHAFLAGMFEVETNMGRLTGDSHYKRSRMGKKNEKAFLRICKKLGLDPNKTLVSSPLPGQRGGAMGKAQFMPMTWEKHEKEIQKIVGKIPNPWDPDHAAIAMALKVSSDAPGVRSNSHSVRKVAEFNAAKLYFSGTTKRKYDYHARKVLRAASKWEKVL